MGRPASRLRRRPPERTPGEERNRPLRGTGRAERWCAAKESTLQPTDQETLTAAGTKRPSRNALRKPGKELLREREGIHG